MNLQIDKIKELLQYANISIVPDQHIPDHMWVRRSWKERLFTLPWSPFKKTKTVDQSIGYMFRNTIFVSYKTFNLLVKEGVVK